MKEIAQQRVLHALESHHAHLTDERNHWRSNHLPGPQAQAQQLANPIAAMVQNHEADRQRDQQQVGRTYQLHGSGLAGALHPMHLAYGEARSRARMASPARRRQVPDVGLRLRIIGRQNIVDTMATRAVRDRLGAGLHRQSVERRFVAGDAIRRKSEPFRQAHVVMAAPTRLRYATCAYRGGLVFRGQDRVLAVTVRAYRRIEDAASHGLAMHARVVLRRDLAVAHAARIRHVLMKVAGLRGDRFMGGSMAHRAIRRGGVTFFRRLPVHTKRIVAGFGDMARRADRLRDTRGVRVRFVLHMAFRTCNHSVRGLRHFCPLIVAGRAVFRGRLLRHARKGQRQHPETQTGSRIARHSSEIVWRPFTARAYAPTEFDRSHES